MSGTHEQRDDRGGEDGTVHDLAAAYALDAVDDVERTQFEAHLADCAACRRTVAELSEAVVGLSEGLEEQPPPGMRQRVLTAVAEEAPRTAPQRTAPDDQTSAGAQAPGGELTHLGQRRAARHGRWWLAAAAAAVVAVGSVVATQWGRDEPGSTVAVQEVLEAEDAQRSTETVNGSTVHVVRSMALQRTVLVAEEMPEPPQGQDYQLWFVHDDGTAVSAGLMPKDGDDRTEVVLQGDPAGAVAVGVTLEPEGGSQQPTSEPIVAVPLEG
ncbi:anti-sigma factor [Ornithinicoccus halotolerans]|uniref:anti-sigma factor n=1 Tax=Ornithinicoccus halotolerans TaxID=1748220 RepID=UPI001296B334|nr:anti-sigma factor [Ornithinicoccus halotolerans]